MADAYGQTVSGEVSTTLGDNTRKTTHKSFNYGTPNVFPLVIQLETGNWDGYANSNSDFHKVMAVIQSRAEIYGIGEIGSGSDRFTLLVNWNTLAQDNTASENTGYPQVDTGDLDYLETAISNATGINVLVYHGKIINGQLDYNEC